MSLSRMIYYLQTEILMVVLSFSPYKKELFSGNEMLYGVINMLVSATLDVAAQPKIHAPPPSLLQ